MRLSMSIYLKKVGNAVTYFYTSTRKAYLRIHTHVHENIHTQTHTETTEGKKVKKAKFDLRLKKIKKK